MVPYYGTSAPQSQGVIFFDFPAFPLPFSTRLPEMTLVIVWVWISFNSLPGYLPYVLMFLGTICSSIQHFLHSLPGLSGKCNDPPSADIQGCRLVNIEKVCKNRSSPVPLGIWFYFLVFVNPLDNTGLEHSPVFLHPAVMSFTAHGLLWYRFQMTHV
ncbi:hypothetical protein JOM56_010885 [Amanita muscaria]